MTSITPVSIFADRFALQAVDHRAHAEVTHVKRILDHDAVQLVGVERVDESLARIKPTNETLPALPMSCRETYRLVKIRSE